MRTEADFVAATGMLPTITRKKIRCKLLDGRSEECDAAFLEDMEGVELMRLDMSGYLPVPLSQLGRFDSLTSFLL